MKVKSIDNLIGVVLGVPMADIKKVEKYEPKAMCLCDEDGDEIYRVFISDDPANLGIINKNGAVFQNVQDEKAIVWLVAVYDDPTNKEAEILDMYGKELYNIKTIESQIKAAVTRTNTMVDGISGDFTDFSDVDSAPAVTEQAQG